MLKSFRKELDLIMLVLLFMSLFIVNKAIFHLLIIPLFLIITIYNLFVRSINLSFGNMNFILMIIGISIFPSMLNSTRYYKDIIMISYFLFGICVFLQIRMSVYSIRNIQNGIFGSLILFSMYNVSITLYTFYSNYVIFGSNYAMGHNVFGNIHQNSYALLLNMLLPCLTYFFMSRTRIMEKTGIILLCIMFSGCIMLTLSKIAFLMLFCNVIFLIFYGFKVSLKKLIIIGVIVFLCAVFLMPDMLKDRFEHLVKGKYYFDRLRIWSHGLKIAAKHPFIGNGYAAYNSICRSLRPKRLYAGFPPMGSYEHSHNFFIHWFLSYGIFSLGLVVFLGIKMIRSSYTNKFFLMLILLFLISSIVDFNFFWYKNMIVFSCLCGIFVKKEEIEKKTGPFLKIIFSIFLMIAVFYSVPGAHDHFKYYDLSGIESFKKGLYKDAQKAFKTGILFSNHNHKLHLRLALSLAAQGKSFEEQIKTARKLNVPDCDGSVELECAVIYDYAGKIDKAVEHYRNYAIKFPDFILNSFFSYRPELKSKILKLLKKDFKNKQKLTDSLYLVRLCEIFYHLGDIELSKKIFKEIDFQKNISRHAVNELDYADIMLFRKEYLIIDIRLGNETLPDINIEKKFQRDEIINEFIKRMFHSGKFKKAVEYSRRLCNERNYLVENNFLSTRIPDGLFYGIHSALRLNMKKDAENFITQLFYEKNNLFIAYLGQSFFELKYGSFQKIKDNLSRFLTELSNKSNPLYINKICSLVLSTDRMKKNILKKMEWNFSGLKPLKMFYTQLLKKLTTENK